ncbi:Uncharacterised protein [Actinobacillus seminis]|uniref:Uncharacterized protein n=1 Tax=Actinobacillus seminis TaxID=722 RepID=A0A380VG09_9PAST|nr:Uncharacterised protein [Actinobacillus seminis]
MGLSHYLIIFYPPYFANFEYKKPFASLLLPSASGLISLFSFALLMLEIVRYDKNISFVG